MKSLANAYNSLSFENIHQQGKSYGCHLDFFKAFDTVTHNILLFK